MNQASINRALRLAKDVTKGRKKRRHFDEGGGDTHETETRDTATKDDAGTKDDTGGGDAGAGDSGGDFAGRGGGNVSASDVGPKGEDTSTVDRALQIASDVGTGIGNFFISPAEAATPSDQQAQAEAAKLSAAGQIPSWAGVNSGANEAAVRAQEESNARKAMEQGNALNIAARASEEASSPVGSMPGSAPASTVFTGNTTEEEQLRDATIARALAQAQSPAGSMPGSAQAPSYSNQPYDATPPSGVPSLPINPYDQGQMPQPIGSTGTISGGDVRMQPSAVGTGTVSGGDVRMQPTVSDISPTVPLPPIREQDPVNAALKVASSASQQGFDPANPPMPPIPLRDYMGPSWAEGIASAFGLGTQQQYDKFYNDYIKQGYSEADADKMAIGDVQTMRVNAKPGPFDRAGHQAIVDAALAAAAPTTDTTKTATDANATPLSPIIPKLPGVAKPYIPPYIPSATGGYGYYGAPSQYADLGAAASVQSQAAYNNAVANALRLLGQA